MRGGARGHAKGKDLCSSSAFCLPFGKLLLFCKVASRPLVLQEARGFTSHQGAGFWQVNCPGGQSCAKQHAAGKLAHSQ